MLYEYGKEKIDYRELDKGVRKMCREINSIGKDIWTVDSCQGHKGEKGYIICICKNIHAVVELLVWAKKNNKKVEAKLAMGTEIINKDRYLFIDRYLPRFNIIL